MNTLEMMKAKRLIGLGLLILLTTAGKAQELTEPGWFQTPEREVQLELKDWNPASQDEGDTNSSGGFSLMSLVSYPEIAEAITPEIQALARGLENDPGQIFAYVRDHIRYVHYFGSKKGAQLTLLERSGNDFDQCALLMALLRAAGHTATYRFGTVAISYEITSGGNYHRDFKHWLGLSEPNTNWTNSLLYAVSLNDNRGFPFTGGFLSVPNILVLHRVWVRLAWNSTVYSLDPAFKVYEPIAGINLATAMGLNTNDVMNAAAGTGDANYVQNMSEPNLRNKLRDYTTNFLSYLQSNYPNYSVEQVLGGQSFYEGQTFGASLPMTPFLWDSNSPPLDWDYIPTNLMSSLNITVDTTTNRFLFMPQLQGQKLALTFTTNGLGQLWLEDELLLQKQTSGGRTVPVAFKIDHPHGSWDWANNRLINTNWNDHAVTNNSYQRTNATYAITYAFEADAEWLRQRQDRLDRYRLQGLADASREITTETLNVMGLNWMIQTERMPRILAAQKNVLSQYHHRFGRMAQEFGKGYYIDIYQQLNGGISANGNTTADRANSDRVFELGTYFGSAAEHALIEQLQASNLLAASTVKMLQIGNTNGQRTYLAHSGNWTTVQGNLSNYNLNSLKTNYIDKGYSLLLPANGSNLLAGAGSWAGYGIVSRGVFTNSLGTYKDMAMLISGDYHGGYVSLPGVLVDTPFVWQNSYVQPSYFALAPPLVGSPFGADPVNMADGAFYLSTTDLTLGQPEPRGLNLTRHYTSSRRFHNLAGMSHGWVHNYFAQASDSSAPLAGLGDTTPAQMAPMIVAAKTAVELYSTTGHPKNWAVMALIAKWGADQLINNAVSVTLGKDTLQFIKQPNGTFTPPAKATMTLLKTNGAYWLQERHGNTFKFNGSGWLTNIVDQYNQSLSLTYNSSNWVSTVKDWKNRQFTFNYTGSPLRLTSVTDNSSPSRTVSYGYTTAGGVTDLTSVTDAENKTSTLIYGTNHQVIATKDALSRVVVSNAYDGFGRVIEQYSQGDTNQTWKLFWAGTVNTEQDPIGGRKQFYFDDKHRQIIVVDALGKVFETHYDGQDHVTRTVSPLNAITDYGYDARHNLLFVNDPLGQQEDLYYDAQDNLVHVWDKRGYHSYFGYNAKFQITGSTNNAGDWVTFDYSPTDGTQTSRTDSGGSTTFGYDSYGQLNRTTFPSALGSEGFLNNSLGDILSRTNARGFVTSFQYNQRRELTNTIAPTNLTVRVGVDAVGNVQSTTDARGFTRSNTWSATRKLLATILPATPQGIPVSTNVYDRRDWLARSLNPLQQAVIYTNDAAQRLASVTDPLNRATKFGYDDDDRKTAITNAANEVTRQLWSSRSELLQTTTPMGTTIKRSFDAGGNQVTLTNRNGKKWQFQFDAANRLTNTITPLNRQAAVTYNNRGLVFNVREPSTQMTTNFHDAKGRLTNAVDGVASRVIRYDANNNVTNIVENGRTNTWTFDAYDRVQSYRDADGYLIQYRHDNNGNLTNLIYPGSRNVFYFYDSLNRLTNVTDWAGRQTSFEYDLANRLKKIIRPNNTVRILDHDAAGQTTNIWERATTGGSNGTPIALFRLNWNNAARMEWEFAAPITPSYTPPTRTMTFDDDNRMATFNGNSVTHDLDGNLTNGPLTNNTLVSYAYDARNRLLSAGGINYGYDPAGNRTAITNGAAITRLVVDPNASLSQVLMRVRSGVTNYYIYGAGLLYEITETATTTNTLTYHYDYRGSTVAMTDSNGNVTDRVNYSPYATIIFRSGTNDTPFLYNGRYGVQTDGNGLLYMRARYYNPYICRFINSDPIGFEGGMNFYAYADGNPVNYLDPYGLSAWTRIGGGLRALGGVFEAAAGYGLAVASGTAAVGTSPTVVGAVGFGALAVGGTAIGAHGVDQVQSGLRQMWTGEHVESLTALNLQAAGMSESGANLTDAGVSIVGSLGAGFGTTAIRATQLSATSVSAEVANASIFAKVGYYEVGQLSLTDDAYAYYSLWGNTLDRGAAMVADQGGGFVGWWRAMSQGSATLGAREGTLLNSLQTAWPTPLGAGGVGAVGGVANWSSQPSYGGK